MVAAKRDKIIDWVRWGLTALVIPLGVWGVTLETDNAVQNERIAELQKYKDGDGLVLAGRVEAQGSTLDVQAEQIKQLREDLKEARLRQKAIIDNTVALGKLEVKIDAVYLNLTEITKILRAP